MSTPVGQNRSVLDSVECIHISCTFTFLSYVNGNELGEEHRRSSCVASCV